MPEQLPEGRTQIESAVPDRIKTLTTLVASLAALATAVAAFTRPPDTTASRNTYEELSQAMKEISVENVKNHDEIVALHAFIDGFLRSQDGRGPISGATSAEPAERTPRHSRPRQDGLGKAEGADKKRVAEDQAQAPQPTAAPAAPPPPEAAAVKALPMLRSRPQIYVPRSFKDVMERKP